MRVFMIGGTGLLGSEAARELIARGHQVVSIALPPLLEAKFPGGVPICAYADLQQEAGLILEIGGNQ